MGIVSRRNRLAVVAASRGVVDGRAPPLKLEYNVERVDDTLGDGVSKKRKTNHPASGAVRKHRNSPECNQGWSAGC